MCADNGGRGSTSRGGTRGFTLVEIAISIFVAALALLVTMSMAGKMTDQLRTQGMRVSAQDNARSALDEITRSLRGAGSGTDYANGQSRFLYADAFTVALNANLTPADDPSNSGTPRAVDPTLSGATVPLGAEQTFTPAHAFGTGAETIVLTVDSNRDAEVTSADAADDEEEQDSTNPRDYVLKSFVYGSDGAANRVTSTGLAVLRGPASSSDGTPTQPLFRYWIDGDNDPSTPSVLHGDTSSDGRLSDAEIAALTPVQSDQLALIERVDVTATAESDKPRDGGEYGSTVLRSSVSFRNRNSTASRVLGKVFHDVDRDGVQDSGEVPLRDVVIRCSNGYKTKTDTDGRYAFVLNPGRYTITEVDPPSYSSTTPNIVSVNAKPGDWVEIDFGDLSTLGTGRIVGKVFADVNQDEVMQAEERGIQGVRIFLDTGVSATTDVNGRYRFTVQTKDYTVTEEDSATYSSSTPNVVQVNLQADGDSVVVNFGDYEIINSGKIHGIVYRDDDNDGVRDTAEPGIPNVTITLDEETTASTDARGEFLLNAGAGVHEVTETDPPGYTSSTVNTRNVTVVARQTTEVTFGDIGRQDITFQEIALGSTDRALSITSLDTGEDNRSDADITLGTHYVGGRNDLLTWWNARINSSTPNSALFTTAPSYQRVVDSDVNSVAAVDLNGDGRDDVVSALGASSNNIAVWLMQGSGSDKGQLPTSPTARYSASLATSVNDVVVGKFDDDTQPDLAIGTTTGSSTGKLEIWHGAGGSSFTRDNGRDIYASIPGLTSVGEIACMASADFTGDGVRDLVLGMRTSTSHSLVCLMEYDAPGRDYSLVNAFAVSGQIQDVLALDMFEDDQNDQDIVLATATSTTAGRIEVWNNRGDNTFGTGDIAGITPDDAADPGGAPLSLVAAKLDNDIFPDIVVGTRTSNAYTGQVVVYRAYGYLPSTGIVVSTSGAGEIITITSADFNKDGAPDLATGTRTSATAGKVVIYFNQRPAL